MTDTTKPTKQRVRDWLEQRIADEDAPPTPEEIREQLGWRTVPNRDEVAPTNE